VTANKFETEFAADSGHKQKIRRVRENGTRDSAFLAGRVRGTSRKHVSANGRMRTGPPNTGKTDQETVEAWDGRQRPRVSRMAWGYGRLRVEHPAWDSNKTTLLVRHGAGVQTNTFGTATICGTMWRCSGAEKFVGNAEFGPQHDR